MIFDVTASGGCAFHSRRFWACSRRLCEADCGQFLMLYDKILFEQVLALSYPLAKERGVNGQNAVIYEGGIYVDSGFRNPHIAG